MAASALSLQHLSAVGGFEFHACLKLHLRQELQALTRTHTLYTCQGRVLGSAKSTTVPGKPLTADRVVSKLLELQ